MSRVIYGVDTNEEVTPKKVLGAIVECFYQAHCEDAALGGDEDLTRVYCENRVKKAFGDSGGDFDDPSKESILKAMGELAEFSRSFRDQASIEKHMGEIGELVEKLEK